MTKKFSALAIRDFRLITQTRLLFSFAVQIQAVVIGWQVYQIKKDPLYLGLTGLVEALPALALALFAGEIVDRSNPLKIYQNVVLLSLLAGLMLWLTATSPQILWLYLAALITGIARGFSGPALFSLIPQIVEREAIRVSSAWTTLAFQLASVGGPAIGGFLFAWKGVRLPYTIEVLSLIAAYLLLTQMEERPKIRSQNEKNSMLENIRTGVRFVFSSQLLLSALALDMFAVLFGGVTALLPIFSEEILLAGPQGLGILRASPAIGALVMSVALIRFPIGRRAGIILLCAVAGFGLCTLGFGISSHFWISASLLCLSGALDSISMVIRAAIVQLCSPDQMRGRIAAVNSVFIGSSNEIGAFESGLAAKLMGTIPSVLFGGTMTLLTVLVTALLAPQLRRMNLDEL